MSISRYAAKVIETRFVWAPTVEGCMEQARFMQERHGWHIEGNPAPMTWAGQYGTGIAISRVNDE